MTCRVAYLNRRDSARGLHFRAPFSCLYALPVPIVRGIMPSLGPHGMNVPVLQLVSISL